MKKNDEHIMMMNRYWVKNLWSFYVTICCDDNV